MTFSRSMSVKGGRASAARYAIYKTLLEHRNSAIRRAYANPDLRERLSQLAFDRSMTTVETRRKREAEKLVPQWVRSLGLKGEWTKVYLRTLCEIEAADHVRAILAKLRAAP